MSKYNSCQKETIEQVLNNPSQKYIVLVYSDSCGHCHNMYDAWKSFTENHNQDMDKINQDVPVQILNVEAQNAPTHNFPNIDGYPTIFYNKNNGKGTEFYGGNRMANDFNNLYNNVVGNIIGGGNKKKKTAKRKSKKKNKKVRKNKSKHKSKHKKVRKSRSRK